MAEPPNTTNPSTRPILFSAPMVRALLDGRKTQTRRMLKPQPRGGYKAWQDEDTGDWFTSGHGEAGDWGPLAVRFGKGDRLWCRETFSGKHDYDVEKWPPRAWFPGDAIWYWADGNPTRGDWTKPKPGIHMPRWASRLTLTVTDVRVQRLQEISETDAIAEGIQGRTITCSDGVDRFLWFGVPECGRENTPVAAYGDLWDSINNPRGLCAEDQPGSWDANPWVVAVSFRVAHHNIDTLPARAALRDSSHA